MNKYCIVAILFLLTASCQSIKTLNLGNAVSNKSVIIDTVNYIKENFIISKDKYMLKPLSYLLNDFPIETISYTYGVSKDDKLSPDIYLLFIDVDIDERDRIDKLACIWVKWQTPLPMDSVKNLMSTSKGKWVEAEKEYFGKQIIKDIAVIGF